MLSTRGPLPRPAGSPLPLLLLLAPACFDRTYPADLPCGPEETCPPGQSCDSDGFCRRSPIDASGADAPPPSIDAACATQSATFTAIADGIFAGPGSGADQPKGDFDIANIGTGIQSRGIFRFNIAAVPTDAAVTDGNLLLTPAPRSDGCSTSCGECAGIESDGTMTVHFFRSDWDELSFTYYLRQTGEEWDSPGAETIGTDRSAALASMPHTAGQPLDLAFPGRDLGTWRDGNELSLLVDPSSGGVIVAATREAGTCEGSYTPPTLTLRYCVD